MESYDVGSRDVPLLDDTIGDAFVRTAARRPDAEALVEVATGRRWTWAELARDVDDAARGLLGLGVAPGDRVGIWAPSCAEWVVVQLATARIGAVLVTVNPAYRTQELAHALRHSGTSLLVAATGFRGSDYGAMVAEVRPDLPDLRRVVLLGTDDWRDLLEVGGALPPDAVDEVAGTLAPDDAINIQYTSGTTGFPKGATLSHRNILNNGHLVTETIRLTEDDRLCVPVPFYHCFGMVMAVLGCVTHGATIVVPAPAFDPEVTLRAVADERCTALYGVPTMFIAMQSHPRFDEVDLSSLRTGIMAGSACPVEVMKRCVEDMHMAEVSIAYGMTETSPVSCQTLADDDAERRTATIGRVHPHLEIKVVDPATGATVPRGEPGEYCTRGYSVMLGYWGEPEKTAEVVDADGWMHTGDLAVMREDGYCTIVGRIKDMVIRGGENIYPREVEEFLHIHPDVEDVQVVGVPDARYGEELCAWLRLRAGAEALDAAAVRAFCEGRLAHFKIPRYVMVVDEFPMTVTGKVRKVDMREESTRALGLA